MKQGCYRAICPKAFFNLLSARSCDAPASQVPTNFQRGLWAAEAFRVWNPPVPPFDRRVAQFAHKCRNAEQESQAVMILFSLPTSLSAPRATQEEHSQNS